MYKIGTFNKISPVGLGKLTDNFALVEDQNEANGIILRRYDMHEMDFSDNLLAIGRAGAGTNNIPVDRWAQQGIVVFNSPGANANAVKELCLAGMIMAARNIPAGIAWSKTLVGSEGVGKQTAARGMLSVFLHKFGSETGLQSDLVHQFLVVKRNAEFFGDHASNGPSTGAKFPADCNNFLFHIDASL